MKPLLLTLTLLFTGLTFAQSKKQQIVFFKLQLDSLQVSIDTMAAINSRLIDQVNRDNRLYNESMLKNVELQQEVEGFKNEVDSLKTKIAELESKISPTGAVADIVNLNFDEYSPNRNRTLNGGPFGRESLNGNTSPINSYSLVDFGTADYGRGRTRFTNYSPEGIRFDTRIEIRFRLFIDPSGRVVHFGFYESGTNVKDLVLINKIGQQIMEQVYCSKDESASLEYLDFSFSSHRG